MMKEFTLHGVDGHRIGKFRSQSRKATIIEGVG